jgi:hypothetical protein
LRALSPEKAEVVGKELVMVIRFLDEASNESLASAFRYAKSAAARAGRVGVVREFEGKVALKQGKYQEAKTALRAAHRILGEDSILIDIAAAELGLERPTKALEILGEVDADKIEKERPERCCVGFGHRERSGLSSRKDWKPPITRER